MTGLIYAIGDIHGRDDLLAKLHAQITEHRAMFRGGRPAKLIHLGDYVDRGRQSPAVIDRLMRGVEGFETLCLLGNHEDMMLQCTASHDPDPWEFWQYCGGGATLDALGLKRPIGAGDPDALCAALGPERLAWLRARPLTHQTRHHLFVHAGIRPGVRLEDQEREDLIWIRYEFLDTDLDHGLQVVHGHTPTSAPVLRPNRIGIDTGVVMHGRLTAVALEDGHAPEFLTVEGEPGPGP